MSEDKSDEIPAENIAEDMTKIGAELAILQLGKEINCLLSLRDLFHAFFRGHCRCVRGICGKVLAGLAPQSLPLGDCQAQSDADAGTDRGMPHSGHGHGKGM